MRIGFDLDGVLAIPTQKRSLFKMFEFYRTCIPQISIFSLPDGEHKIYVITGRKECFRRVTVKWLKDCDFHYEDIFFFHGKEKTAHILAAHKINVIKRLGIKLFFEDDAAIAKEIGKAVPGCRVELVKRKQ